MRGLLLAWIMTGCLFLACAGSVNAQGNQPPPPAPPVVETKKVERDGSSQVVHYMLAGIGTIIVMVLICMPARRE
jgi:hypothetical protein